MADYGTVEFENKPYILDNDADFTNRLLSYPKNIHEVDDDEEYDAEFFAPAHDAEGNKFTVYWIQTFTKGDEPEDLSILNWDNIDRIENY